MMTAREREKGNRQCVAAALVMLVGAFQCGWCAADLASWRAVGFALCGLGSAVALGVSALLFWVATSVVVVDGGRVEMPTE